MLSIFEKPKATGKMSSRHGPLQACGVTILAIVEISLGKTQDINGPLGSILRRMGKLVKFATPFIYTLEYQLLTMLSFIDHRILAIEKITENLFPPSRHVFNKIDEIAVVIMTLPEKFDGAVNTFPTMIHQVPFLEGVLTLVISRLNSLVSILNHWGQESYSRVNEKTIGVDRSCNESSMDSSDDVNCGNLGNFPPILSESGAKEVQDLALSSQMVGSYKEALERGKEEDPDENVEKSEKKLDGSESEVSEEREKNDGDDNEEKIDSDLMKYQVGKSEMVKNDPILELFESAWLMKPGRH
ncbi:hypothetical protein VNO77_01356 [Canavalia gladiata]|uniref:Uncharacterized protein n=1 Tax=Canavalia gladiata TaxID=3824 RepID=A0AAN9MVX5_CANGL